MAKVKDPFGAREARGSVGGIVSSRNSMGQYFRCKASPVQPRTAEQQARRYDFQKLVREFQDLTQAQIEEWALFAANWTITDCFGDQITTTALNWYIALNSRLMAIGVASQSTPPLNPDATYTPTIDIDQDVNSGGDIEMTYSPAPTGNERIWVMYTGNLPKSSLFTKKSMRLRTKVASTDASPHTLIQYADLSYGDSLIQFLVFGVDDEGRATPRLRDTVYPVSVS